MIKRSTLGAGKKSRSRKNNSGKTWLVPGPSGSSQDKERQLGDLF